MTKRIAVPIIAALALVFAVSVALVARAQSGAGACCATGQQGTGNNTQQGLFFSTYGFARVTSNSPVTLLTLSPPTGASDLASISWICRAVSGTGVTAGDTWSTNEITTFKNIGGTASFTSSGSTVVSSLSDTSMSGVQAGFQASGGSVNVRVTGLASVTIDCTARADVIGN